MNRHGTVRLGTTLADRAGGRPGSAGSLAYHQDLVYAHDAVVGPGAERGMEAVMYHYEAVLRKAIEGKVFSLRTFYKSNHIAHNLEEKEVRAKVPVNKELVCHVRDFKDGAGLVRLLNQGFIVVSY